MSSWYVVHTQINREHLAAQHLRRQDFEVFLPRLRKRRRHARRVETVLAPMFPRYLFVCMDIAACRWRAINSTVGVSHVVSFGLEPTAMPGGVVEELLERADELGGIKLQPRVFRVGDRLRILDGAFADQVGTFEALGERDRVTLLLDILGRQVRVKAPVEFLATA